MGAQPRAGRRSGRGFLSVSSLLCTETRADRSKKLFRHYTVGSYDSFDACR